MRISSFNLYLNWKDLAENFSHESLEIERDKNLPYKLHVPMNLFKIYIRQ